MEKELTNHLIDLGTRFGQAKGLEESTVGRMCAADSRFFSRLHSGQTFTAKKYDKVVAWFAANWPAGADWPHNVARPKVAA